MELCGGRPFSVPRQCSSTPAMLFVLVVSLIWIPQGVYGVEARMESQFEKCCGLGTSWASEGLRCEKFTGPVQGVPRIEQGLCLEAVDICCVRAYHEKSCEKGKDDARAGLACVQGGKSRNSPCPGDERRDCCEGCKLGILTGSMGQGCAFKSFAFGKPWDPSFLECCHEASPTTTANTDSDTSSTSIFSTDTTTSANETTSPSSSTTSMSPSDSTSPEIPTPVLDDICQLMRGLLCSDICVPTPGSFYCKCPEGSILLEDGKTCRKNETEDRCKSKNPCEHRCKDTGASVVCSCNPGFILAEDAHSCSPVSGRIGEPSDEDNELEPLCPGGYKYNKTGQVCDDIDECETNPCPGVCKNVVGSFLCLTGPANEGKRFGGAAQESCPPGYQWDPQVQLCTDIDECVDLSGACGEDTHVCVNTQGSFTCHELIGPKGCPAGFKFDVAAKICRDVDECAEGIHGCLPEVEECRNTAGAYDCDITCRKGFAYSQRSGICLDVDECTETLHPCPDPETRCVNNVGGYECKKLSSLDQTVTEVPLDPASSRVEDDSDVSSEDCVGENGADMCSNRSDNSIETIDDNSAVTMREEEARGEPEVAGSDYDEVVLRDKKFTAATPRRVNVTIEDTEYVLTRDCPSGAFWSLEKRSCVCRAGYEIDPVSGECRDPLLRTTTGVPPSASSYKNFEPCLLGYRRDRSSGECRDIDECLDGPGCQEHERCENLRGGYNCIPRCDDGWQYDATTSSCRDVDECALGVHDCAPASHRCVNKNGTYTCERLTTCPTGHRRIYNGSCVDVDECVEGPGCREYERCKNLPGGYDCSPLCGAGWHFDPSTRGCLDVDECLLGRHDCPQGTHRCVNVNGTYNCQLVPPCTSGFRKLFNGSCVDIDECAENLHDCPLSFHRYCVNREGTYECVTRYPDCPKGYEYSLRTRNCQDKDECASGDFTCDSRFSEKCVNLPGSYRCERPPSSGQGQRQRPACPSGFRYDSARRQCTDIDECAEGTHSCGNEVCYNQPGGYSCARAPIPLKPKPRPPTMVEPAGPGQQCKPGAKYVRNRGCVDIDECQEDPEACTSNENCINTPGSFVCECKLGFRRDELTQACVDINECQLENNCQPSQRCDNTLGSYTCVRYLPCGTGYTLNAATGFCEDDNECDLGTHDCTGGYHCRNTLGSYRCDKNLRSTTQGPRVSAVTARVTATTPTVPRVTPGPRGSCPPGYSVGPRGQCIDIDECQRSPSPCARSSLQKCVNTMGSYRCVSRVLCGNGYTLDPASGSHCVDVDECADGSHECGPGQTCQNRQGGYVCECPPGHAVGPDKNCLDIDECSIYSGQHFGSVCGPNSRCENTPGSYRCLCESGFENAAAGPGPGVCQDIDECEKTPGLCQHDCINAWGSYRCSCKLGFRLNADNRSCTDIDECTEFKENNLCIGICENTPGSYACGCPAGYKLGVDQRTCQDIDECASGRVCRDPSEICQNTRGSFRCNKIDCPAGYYRDSERKNRCVRTSRYCPSGDLACFRAPSHFSYNFITFVSMLPIPSTGQLELFTMRGTHLPGSTVQFSMALVDARAPPGVVRATESHFALRRPAPSQAVLVLTRPIAGPQEIELDLSMEIYHNTAFAGSAVAKLFIFVSQYEF